LLPIFAFEIIEKDEIECKGQHSDQHLKGFFEEKQKNRKTEKQKNRKTEKHICLD